MAPEPTTALSLNVFLLRETVGKPEDAFRKPTSLTRRDVDLGSQTAELWVQRPDPSVPTWLEFLRGQIIGDPLPASWVNRSISAVLLLRIADDSRWAAIAFGQGGRFLLEPDRIERDFGLHAARNALDPSQLRGIDARTLDAVAINTRRQSSRAAPVLAFEHDELRDLVSGLSGPVGGIDKATRMSGRESANVGARLLPSDVPALCDRLFELHRGTQYKAGFGFLDNIQPLEDTKKLDLDLIDAIRTGNTSKIDLNPPEILEDVGLRFLALAAEAPDPGSSDAPEATVERLRTELSEYKSNEEAQKRLARLRVFAVYDNGETIPWAAYRCLHYERRTNGEVLVLSDGRWWEVSGDFADDVTREVGALPAAALGLPLWDAGSERKEGDYNVLAANTLGWASLDQKNITLTGRSAIEPCDLLSPEGCFVHVKRYSGSGTLSHLFAQGSVSAELFVESAAFREKLRAKVQQVKPALISAVTADPNSNLGAYKVVYAVAAPGEESMSDTLPFFSQVSLRTHARRIKRLGLEVAVERFTLLPADSGS